MTNQTTTPHNAWKQIVAGIDAIQWSRLALWDAQSARLQAAKGKDSFNNHWRSEIHPRSGRWICWMAFGVGSESLTRGAFALHGYEVPGTGFGASQPWGKLKMLPQYHSEVGEAIRKLSCVRNKDAHRYWPNVRETDFPLVDSKFVPALNRIIECLGRDELLARYANSSVSSQT
jgi:hypothetical protein